MPKLTAQQRGFLDAQPVAYLATVDAAGAPHVVPVCFALSEHSAYVVSDGEGNRTGTKLDRRLRNLAGNPAASLAVDHYEDDWDRLAWVRLDGPAEVFTSGGEHADAVRLLRERYPQFDDRPLEGAPMIALRIERVLSFGPLDVSGGARGSRLRGVRPVSLDQVWSAVRSRPQ